MKGAKGDLTRHVPRRGEDGIGTNIKEQLKGMMNGYMKAKSTL
jgi:hypothetical protein